jgi:thiol-disulfide isomerase/thioredoxin
MSTTTRTRRPAAKPARRGIGNVWIPAAVVVAVALIVAVVATRKTGPADDTAGLEQTRPVTVSGAPLPEYAPGADPAVGTPAPELRGASFDGTPVNVTRDGRGKVLLFAAHWCPHCQREVPAVVEHLRDRPLPDGVDLVAVVTSTVSSRPNYPPSSWLRRVGWTAPVLVDDASGAAATAYGLNGFPYFVAVGRDGKVVARASGEIGADGFDRLARLAAG